MEWQKLERVLRSFWKNVDQGTSARFIEWVYKGYYTLASFSLQTVSPSPIGYFNSILSFENDYSHDHTTEDDMAPCPGEEPDMKPWFHCR